MKKGLSVIICSYNSGFYLKETLRCLRKQKTSQDLKWELIFVDNASNQDVVELVKDEWQSEVPLQLLVEKKKGKYYAFQRAIEAANYGYFIICDDDNFLQINYLSAAFKLMENNKNIGALGGLSLAKFAQDAVPPSWFNRVKEHYAVGPQNPTNGTVKSKHLWGAGLCSRTELYRHLYTRYPSLLIDKEESAKLIAEDTEYCLRLQLIGYKLYYSDELQLQHYVPEERLNDHYLNKLAHNRTVSFPVLEKYYIYLKVSQSSIINKIRLLIIAPLRYLLAKSEKSKRRQSVIIQCIFRPFLLHDGEIDIIHQIAKH